MIEVIEELQLHADKKSKESPDQNESCLCLAIINVGYQLELFELPKHKAIAEQLNYVAPPQAEDGSFYE